jgi:hypothetical protein
MMCSRCSRLVVRKNRCSAWSGARRGVRGAAVLATLQVRAISGADRVV